MTKPKHRETRHRARRRRTDGNPTEQGKLTDHELRVIQEKTARDVKDPSAAAGELSRRLQGGTSTPKSAANRKPGSKRD